MSARLPELLSAGPGEAPGSYIERVRVSAELVYFRGHFEGGAVLPAVAQITALLGPAIERGFPALGPLLEAEGLRFEQPIGPDEIVELRLDPDPRGGGWLRFRIQRSADRLAQGRLRMAERPAESR
ncbi:MAG: hypothetical protein OEY14_03770 [Myxococcales bacterium]|nr:hypothetical protein [Myxococcales bacterium]